MFKLRRIYEKVGLKYTIFIIYGILLVGMIVSTSLISSFYVRKNIKKDIYDNLMKTNYQFNENIDYTLAIYETVLNNLCVNDYLQSILDRNTEDRFQAYLDLTEIRKIFSVQNLYPDIIKIEIIPEKGLYLIDRDVIISKDDNINWYNNIIKNDYYNIEWMYIKDKYFKWGQKEDVIQISRQIKDFKRDQLLGVIRITVRIESINKLLSSYAYKDNNIILFDDIGNVIFTSDGLNRLIGGNIENDIKEYVDEYEKEYADENIEKYADNSMYENVFREVKRLNLSERKTGEHTININGKKTNAFYCSDNRAGFVLVNIISREYPLQKLAGLEFIIVIIGLIVLAIGLFADFLLSNYLTKDIHVLVNKVKSVSQGNTYVNFSDVSSNRKDEIGYLYKQFDIMMEKIDSLYKDIYESKIKQKEIELKALQAQINPHFLYNTLSSINWMAIDIDAKDISHAINTLAKYYRFTLSKGREIIPIFDEIEQVKAYIDIQKIRFGKKFDVVYNIDEDVYKYVTPKLILQPFVENSIIHGLEHVDYMGLITIIAIEEESKIKFEIKDNGKGIEKDILRQLTSADLSRSGYGIKNAVEKINLLYGDKYGVNIESEEFRGTCITINIPKLSIENGEVLKGCVNLCEENNGK